MKTYDLDTPIARFGTRDNIIPWTLRNAVEGCQIMGSVGSGKSSSSGRTILMKYLKMGMGGLVLTVKGDEAEMIKSYCDLAGRKDQLIVIEPDGHFKFDFLKYLSDSGNKGGSITGNILETLKTVIRASEQHSSGKSDDPFWEKSLDQLLYCTIDLCNIAYGQVGVEMMYDIVQSLPKKEAAKDKSKKGAFEKAYRQAKSIVQQNIDKWGAGLSAKEKKELEKDEDYNAASERHVPGVRLLRYVDVFFFETFKELNEKTRSIIEFTFTSFLFRLLRDPIYSIFCSGTLNIRPEDSLGGKIILLSFPVKEYHKAGTDVQMLFKYIWQVAMEKRNIKENDRPVFLYADEAQHFLHEHDSTFQATARSSRICTVYITQNLPNYMSAMGGETAESRVKSFLATLNTKIFHANNDVDTNSWASQLIGDGTLIDPSRTYSMGEQFSQSDTVKIITEKRVKPEDFARLRTGGKQNNYKAEAYIHVQGDPLFDGENFNKVKFSQQYK